MDNMLKHIIESQVGKTVILASPTGSIGTDGIKNICLKLASVHVFIMYNSVVNKTRVVFRRKDYG